MTFPSGGYGASITHWGVTPDGFGGNTFGTPAVLDGRWQEKAEVFTDASGQEQKSQATVHVGTNVSIGDYLFEGESSVADPTTLSGAHQVRGFKRTPDLRNVEMVRKAFL